MDPFQHDDNEEIKFQYDNDEENKSQDDGINLNTNYDYIPEGDGFYENNYIQYQQNIVRPQDINTGNKQMIFDQQPNEQTKHMSSQQ